MITMSFRVDVRLLKLALYTSDEEWIDIAFKYDPNRKNNNFVLPIPVTLPLSEYYIARWSVTDDIRGLVNGEFKFAFGDDAIPPSETIAAKVSNRVEILPSTGSYRRETIQELNDRYSHLNLKPCFSKKAFICGLDFSDSNVATCSVQLIP